MQLFNLALILTVGLFFTSTIMSAADQDPNFTPEKDREIANVKERIHILEERFNCMRKTKDFESLKSCNQAADKKLDVLEAKIKMQPHDKRATSDTKHPDNKHPDTKNKPN
ncbi:hypothetical protein [Nitrosomonas supralitoralis]|uniref:Uncharacterized protein n=1 Tax=Nitrosomonas supralitoralis TaxID=2116706 RepID=A0A2P7NRF3_9PROT|nr:hypothetical protein [Nitrosomonas supralitoralis]PSJ16052.1 hypothetical protein C7H79_15655 [Nitrosomonas supralitoralis]